MDDRYRELDEAHIEALKKQVAITEKLLALQLSGEPYSFELEQEKIDADREAIATNSALQEYIDQRRRNEL